MRFAILIPCVLACLAALASGDAPKTTPVELGDVSWRRSDDFVHALSQAREEKKPLLILFQEVPG